jgi:hypothetical protein
MQMAEEQQQQHEMVLAGKLGGVKERRCSNSRRLFLKGAETDGGLTFYSISLIIPMVRDAVC